ncbi:la-related protein 6B-like [Impatiens glandulifera]|uniref:la-related protein 6B-like n=1 Tax=Impatiens glandulifera TaxID=253017 RepID=UPI001FB1798D|nr:la-related protein 6B-like [Impatiens glandulifera]
MFLSVFIVTKTFPFWHCQQNLVKIFSAAVGSVKNIRTCPPQAPNNGASPASRSAKADMPFLAISYMHLWNTNLWSMQRKR